MPRQTCCPSSCGSPLPPFNAQTDEFSFRLPGLGSLTQLRVGHEGRKDWHLERVEVVDTGSGTTHYFPCDKARGREHGQICIAAVYCLHVLMLASELHGRTWCNL